MASAISNSVVKISHVIPSSNLISNGLTSQNPLSKTLQTEHLTSSRSLIDYVWTAVICKASLLGSVILIITSVVSNTPIITAYGSFFLLASVIGYTYTQKMEKLKAFDEAADNLNDQTADLKNAQKTEVRNVAKLQKIINQLKTEKEKYIQQLSDKELVEVNLTKRIENLHSETQTVVESIKNLTDISATTFTEINEETRNAAKTLGKRIKQYDEVITKQKQDREDLMKEKELLQIENDMFSEYLHQYDAVTQKFNGDVTKIEGLLKKKSVSPLERCLSISNQTKTLDLQTLDLAHLNQEAKDILHLIQEHLVPSKPQT